MLPDQPNVSETNEENEVLRCPRLAFKIFKALPLTVHVNLNRKDCSAHSKVPNSGENALVMPF